MSNLTHIYIKNDDSEFQNTNKEIKKKQSTFDTKRILKIFIYLLTGFSLLAFFSYGYINPNINNSKIYKTPTDKKALYVNIAIKNAKVYNNSKIGKIYYINTERGRLIIQNKSFLNPDLTMFNYAKKNVGWVCHAFVYKNNYQNDWRVNHLDCSKQINKTK